MTNRKSLLSLDILRNTIIGSTNTVEPRENLTTLSGKISAIVRNLKSTERVNQDVFTVVSEDLKSEFTQEDLFEAQPKVVEDPIQETLDKELDPILALIKKYTTRIDDIAFPIVDSSPAIDINIGRRSSPITSIATEMATSIAKPSVMAIGAIGLGGIGALGVGSIIARSVTSRVHENLVSGVNNNPMTAAGSSSAPPSAVGAPASVQPSSAPMQASTAAGAYDIAARIGVSPAEWDIYRSTIGHIESGGFSNPYAAIGGAGNHYDGRYQMGSVAKQSASSILGDLPELKHDGTNRARFRSNPTIQERAFAAFTLKNVSYIGSSSGFNRLSPQEKLVVLAYAHNQGAGAARSWMRTGVAGRDAFGTSGTKYSDAVMANLGLRRGGSTSTASTSAPSSRSPTSSGASSPVTSQNQLTSNSSLNFGNPLPMQSARIGSRFGMRRHPITGQNRMHAGQDFGAPTGTPIFATESGVVTRAQFVRGYGNLVDISHNSIWSTRYAHASAFASGIRPGTRVTRGQVIAYVGSTGMSTGPHLHYEIRRNGVPVDPLNPGVQTSNDIQASAGAGAPPSPPPPLYNLDPLVNLLFGENKSAQQIVSSTARNESSNMEAAMKTRIQTASSSIQRVYQSQPKQSSQKSTAPKQKSRSSAEEYLVYFS